MRVLCLLGAGGRKKLHRKMGSSSGATRGLWSTSISLLGSALGSSAVTSRKRGSTGYVWADRELFGVGVEVWTDRDSFWEFMRVWVAADVMMKSEVV